MFLQPNFFFKKMNLSLNTYLQAAKNITFNGVLNADECNVVLVPHIVTKTPCGKSTRLIPSLVFPSCLIGNNYYEMAYLNPNVFYNSKNSLPSKIMKMFFYLEPFNEKCIRDELNHLAHDKESIDLFLTLFPILQKQNLSYSQLAQASKHILEMKQTCTLFECKVNEMDKYFSNIVHDQGSQKLHKMIQEIKPIAMEKDISLNMFD